MKLQELHRDFLLETFNNKLPIAPKAQDKPVIVMDRWRIVDNVLTKKYSFRKISLRNTFISLLMSYEESTTHCAKLVITEKEVILEVFTQGVDHVTELDKEYARFSDSAYKDVVYSSDE